MLEILYRIYEVADEQTASRNLEVDRSLGIFSSTSKAENIELLMDCKICDSREQFKNIIRFEYGPSIAFAFRKGKLKAGSLYCVIIGEHCYNTERYFNKVMFKCDYCGSSVTTYIKHSIMFDNYEINHFLFNIQDYKNKKFCCEHCKHEYLERERQNLKPDDENEFWVSKDMFTQQNVQGYIYKITKKSTDEFYVGQTQYAPVFRWGQHLKTERFHISGILDYKFEVIEIVPKDAKILEREKYWIQKLYLENPSKSLNIACTANLMVNS